MRRVVHTVVIVTVLLLSVSAFAHSGELLTFAGLGDMQPVGNFYNGGGLTSTPNYGVTFSSNFFGLKSTKNGGIGDFNPTPTGNPAIFVNGNTGTTATGTMNVTNGFSTGLNFFFAFKAYAGGPQTVTVTIWSGANGTGTALATITLQPNSCSNAPYYCQWSQIGASFSGTAHSVTFTGTANQFGIADVTVGSSSTAIPEPATLYLIGTGMIGLALRMRRHW